MPVGEIDEHHAIYIILPFYVIVHAKNGMRRHVHKAVFIARGSSEAIFLYILLHVLEVLHIVQNALCAYIAGAVDHLVSIYPFAVSNAANVVYGEGYFGSIALF